MSTSWFATMLFGLMLACPFFSQVIDTPIEPPMAVEPVQESAPPMIENELTIEGVVVEHINDCIFDGICAVVVETADGSQYQVIYAPGMMMCPNPNLDPNIWELVVGDQVEAYGEVLEDGSILLCNRDVYYLNKLTS